MVFPFFSYRNILIRAKAPYPIPNTTTKKMTEETILNQRGDLGAAK
jgi:hypothetical protein